MPMTAPATGWHFTPEDWDALLEPLESGDMERVDAGIRDICFRRIRRRHSPARIRERLGGNAAVGAAPFDHMICG